MQQVFMPEKKKDTMPSLGAIGTLAGAAIGGIYSGGTGAYEGAQIGGGIGGMGDTVKGAFANNNQQQSNPITRRQQAIQNDPLTQLRQGQIALNSMDDNTKKTYQPILEEAMKRASLKQQQQQYNYGQIA